MSSVFITGATGYLGGETARELMRRGHRVVALARPESVSKLPEGVVSVVGDLYSPTEERVKWIDVAARCRAFVHIGADMNLHPNEIAKLEEPLLFEVLGAARKLGRGSDSEGLECAVMTTSAAVSCCRGVVTDEDAVVADAPSWTAGRFECERRFLNAGSAVGCCGIRTCSVRPSWVYGTCGVKGGKGGLVKTMVSVTPEGFAPACVLGGTAALPLVHLSDIARLYAFLVETPSCRGAFHAVSEVTTWKEFFVALSNNLGHGGKIKDMSLDEGRQVMGMFADLMSLDIPLRAAKATSLGFHFAGAPLMPNFETFFKEALST